jgi:hypothetical protein
MLISGHLQLQAANVTSFLQHLSVQRKIWSTDERLAWLVERSIAKKGIWRQGHATGFKLTVFVAVSLA